MNKLYGKKTLSNAWEHYRDTLEEQFIYNRLMEELNQINKKDYSKEEYDELIPKLKVKITKQLRKELTKTNRLPYVSKEMYRLILNTFFKKLVRYIIEEGKIFNMENGLGYIGIKYVPFSALKIKKKKLNFKRTKEVREQSGKEVNIFHDTNFVRWSWLKVNICKVLHCQFYEFKPTNSGSFRDENKYIGTKEMLSKHVIENPEVVHQYLQQTKVELYG